MYIPELDDRSLAQEPDATLTIAQDFERYILSEDFSKAGCIPWCHSITKEGYGNLHWQGRKERAHRVAYQLYYNDDPKVVMHKCDNPLCVNPLHLLNGTIELNNKDRAYKGRTRTNNRTTGKNKNSKLTCELVKQMREHYTTGLYSRKALAAEYNVSVSNVDLIVTNKAWKHLV